MEREHLRTIVLAALIKVAPDVDPETVPGGVDLREHVELDSMDFLTFVEQLHLATGVAIRERDYPQLASVDGAVEYLAARATPGPT